MLLLQLIAAALTALALWFAHAEPEGLLAWAPLATQVLLLVHAFALWAMSDFPLRPSRLASWLVFVRLAALLWLAWPAAIVALLAQLLLASHNHGAHEQREALAFIRGNPDGQKPRDVEWTDITVHPGKAFRPDPEPTQL